MSWWEIGLLISGIIKPHMDYFPSMKTKKFKGRKTFLFLHNVLTVRNVYTFSGYSTIVINL